MRRGEFGNVADKSIQNFERLLAAARDLQEVARPALDILTAGLQGTQERTEGFTTRISEMQADDVLARRLATVPEVGAISSSAFAAITSDVSAFRSGGDRAAWPGLTSRAHFSGGKEWLGGI